MHKRHFFTCADMEEIGYEAFSSSCCTSCLDERGSGYESMAFEKELPCFCSIMYCCEHAHAIYEVCRDDDWFTQVGKLHRVMEQLHALVQRREGLQAEEEEENAHGA